MANTNGDSTLEYHARFSVINIWHITLALLSRYFWCLAFMKWHLQGFFNVTYKEGMLDVLRWCSSIKISFAFYLTFGLNKRNEYIYGSWLNVHAIYTPCLFIMSSLFSFFNFKEFTKLMHHCVLCYFVCSIKYTFNTLSNSRILLL